MIYNVQCERGEEEIESIFIDLSKFISAIFVLFTAEIYSFVVLNYVNFVDSLSTHVLTNSI